MRFAVLVLGFAFSGAAWATDSDGDGVEDDVDACPMDDASGHDLYVDGCVDTLDDYEPYLESLGLDPDAEDVLVIFARAAARSMADGHAFASMVNLHASQDVARALADDRTITPRQLRAINDFVRALVAM
jgi:hypothetical protein